MFCPDEGWCYEIAHALPSWMPLRTVASPSRRDTPIVPWVDLILISSHHRHWIDRYRQTNNIAYILHHAPCPILTVNDDGELLRNRPDPNG